jgi:hypothetical protein
MDVLELLWDSDIKVSPNMHAVKLKHLLEDRLIEKHSSSSSNNNNNNNNNKATYIMESNKLENSYQRNK